MDETDKTTLISSEDAEVERAREADALPVVARLVVEIRSDGSRTVARGALEDRASGQEVAIRADGTSPAALALALARSIMGLPALARRPGAPARKRPSLRRAIRGALRGRKR